MTRLSESIAIKAPIEEVFEVISDFENYPEFLHEIVAARIVKRAKGKAEVDFTAQIVSRINYTLDMKLSPPGRIDWSLIKGEFMEGNDGSWELAKLEPRLTDATFSVEMRFPMWVPKSFAEGTLKSGLPKMLREVKQEAETRFAKKTAKKPPAKPKKKPAAKKSR